MVYMHGRKGPKGRVAERAVQFTVRGVPPRVEKALKRKAVAAGKSLNGLLLEALSREAGIERELLFDDIDRLAGLWQEDPEFDEAVRAQDRVDEGLWK